MGILLLPHQILWVAIPQMEDFIKKSHVISVKRKDTLPGTVH